MEGSWKGEEQGQMAEGVMVEKGVWGEEGGGGEGGVSISMGLRVR